MKNPFMILELPEEEEIAVKEELRTDSNPAVFTRTIRYKNGLVMILTQNFKNSIFRIELVSGNSSFFLMGNHILSVDG